jgi:hypothetical protein
MLEEEDYGNWKKNCHTFKETSNLIMTPDTMNLLPTLELLEP